MAATFSPLEGLLDDAWLATAWWHGRMDAARSFWRRAWSSFLAFFLEESSFWSVLSMPPESMSL